MPQVAVLIQTWKKPWKNLIDDPHSNDISVEEIIGIIEPELPKIMEEQKNREKVISETAAKSQEVPTA